MHDASFGLWLQQRRKARGLTQAELGAQVGVSAASIRKIEADERRPSPDIAVRLAKHLDIPQDEQGRFVRYARGESSASPDSSVSHRDQARWRAPTPPIRNLPIPSAPLIGRSDELATICELLSRPAVRLVTLTGPGGTGKTRLALAAADELAEQFGDGIAFVALAPLSASDLVLSAIAQALGVKESGEQPLLPIIQAYLRDRRLLLVLDNFEHLLEAAAVVSDLLAAAAYLKILVTSREVLHLSGEYDVPIPPLPVPDARRIAERADMTQYDSVRLFVQRAQAVNRAWRLSDENVGAVAEICARLDGLPLAIELAAARSRVLSPQQIASRLNNRFALLTQGARDLPARQQTIRNAIDWSYHLLSDAEQRLFARLSVFAGGWTLDAAEAVCGEDGVNVLDGLQSLVDKSLVQQATQPDGELRFSMLETIREYARERLRESNELEAIQKRRTFYFLNFLEAADPELWTAHQNLWFERIELERPNVSASLAWSTTQPAGDTALRLSLALQRFWHVRGYFVEARRWLDAVLALPTPADLSLRAKALGLSGMFACEQGDYAQAVQLYEESLRLFRQLGDDRGIAGSLGGLGKVALKQGDYARATSLFHESLTRQQALGDRQIVASVLHNLGLVALAQGDFTRATHFHEESLMLYHELGDKWSIAWVLNNLGNIAAEQTDYAHAIALYEDSRALYQELGDKRGVAGTSSNIGLLAAEHGDYDLARERFQEMLDVFTEAGDQGYAATARLNLAMLAMEQGNFTQAEELSGQSLAWYREFNDKAGMAGALTLRGQVAALRGNRDGARQLFEESLRLSLEVRVTRYAADAHHGLGRLAHAAGDDAAAARMLRKSLTLFRQLGDKRYISMLLLDLASVATALGMLESAVRLLGAAEHLRHALGVQYDRMGRQTLTRTEATLRAQLDEKRFKAGLLAAAAMPLDQVVAYVPGDCDDSGPDEALDDVAVIMQRHNTLNV